VLAASESRKAAQRIEFKSAAATSSYDLVYHRMDWKVDPREPTIQGSVTSHFQALTDMDEIVFDLAGNMNVTSVRQRETNLDF